MMNKIYDHSSPDPSKVMFFDFGKTATEILDNTTYKFTLPPAILVRNSETTRRAKRNKKKGIKKAPRRQNPWIIYRRDKSAKENFFGLKSSLISQQISEMWKNEPKEVKDLFEVLAKIAEGIHETEHKDYKYVPGPSKKLKPEKKNNSNDMYEGKILDLSPYPPTPTTDNTMSPQPDTLPSPDSPQFIKLSISGPPTPTTDTSMPSTPTTPTADTACSPSPLTPTSPIPTSSIPTSSIPTSPIPTSSIPTSSIPTSPIPTFPIAMSPSAITTSNPPSPTTNPQIIYYSEPSPIDSWDQHLFIQNPDIFISGIQSMEQDFFSFPQDEDSDDFYSTTTSTITTTTQTISYVEEYSDWYQLGFEEIETQYPHDNHYNCMD